MVKALRPSTKGAVVSVISIYLALSLSACGGSSNDDAAVATPAAPYVYQPPTAKADDWPVASATDWGMDVSLMERLLDNIKADRFGYRNMDGIVLIKDGHVIFEQLLRQKTDVTDGWINNTNLNLHAVHSVSKSVMSAAMGIAIERGEVGGIDDRALDYFDDLAPFANFDSRKQSMTLEHWLTMQHGLQWDEWNVNYLNNANQNKQMIDSPTPMRFLLDLPTATEPGSTFAYSTGISYALGQVIARSSGQTFYHYIQTHLFTPLGITNFNSWMMLGDAHAGSSLYLTMRDMAKFGQMYLDGGIWMGQQVVPSDWVTLSTQEHVSEGNIHYGYQWWLARFTVKDQVYESVYADGWGGQYIMLFPVLNSVVILTGHRYEDGMAEQTSVRGMLEDYILPFLETGN